MPEFVEATDNDGHRYIIPYERLDEWRKWQDIPADDERSWDTPAFAERIDGATVVFTGYRLE